MLTVGRDFRAERAVIAAVLVAVVAVAWAYLFALAAAMGGMGSSLAMPMTADWTVRDWVFMAAMWAVMMIGMMVPSASPMILSYSSFTRGEALMSGEVADGHRRPCRLVASLDPGPDGAAGRVAVSRRRSQR